MVSQAGKGTLKFGQLHIRPPLGFAGINCHPAWEPQYPASRKEEPDLPSPISPWLSPPFGILFHCLFYKSHFWGWLLETRPEPRNQGKEYVNGKKNVLIKAAKLRFPRVGNHFFRFNCGGVRYQHCRAEDREASVLPGTLAWPCVCRGSSARQQPLLAPTHGSACWRRSSLSPTR